MKWVAAKSGFDEVFGRGQSPRAHYASLISILESFTLEDVARRERLQRLALMNQGITFTVYGEKEGLERIFPFDFVPRIIPAAEWKLVQDGLVWREVEPTTPPQVTYGLTEFGRDVGEPLTELFDRITRRLSPRSTG